jgi:hypothetical protein
MTFGREHETARPSAVPNWLREFAEDALRRSANGTNPFQEIKGLFQQNKDLGAIETRVRELKDRIGLSLLAEREAAEAESTSTVKTASVGRTAISRLVRLANWLDEHGVSAEAQEIDGIIRARAAKETVQELFKRFPKLQVFVDNVIRSRAGHVAIPALLKMIRDERPEESQAASDPALREYLESRVGEERQVINDVSDNVAGLGVGLSTSQEEMAEDNKMFEPSKPAR